VACCLEGLHAFFCGIERKISAVSSYLRTGQMHM